jgi:rod shape-determining protein MreC
VLVLAALTLVTIDARSNGSGVLSDARSKVSDAFSPLQRATHAALRPIGNFLSGALNYGSEKAENQRLRQDLANQQVQAAVTQAEQIQYEQLFTLLHLPFAKGIPYVTAQVIDNSPSNFETTITINKGRSDGIADGQPVVAAGGLVGTVQLTSSHQATIVLITNPNFVVGVSLPQGNVGSAQGLGRTEPMKVTVVPTSNTAVPRLHKGDILLTSGLDTEKFPKGIPVGRVTQVSTSPTDPEPDITITPTVDLGNLSYLNVMLWAPQL